MTPHRPSQSRVPLRLVAMGLVGVGLAGSARPDDPSAARPGSSAANASGRMPSLATDFRTDDPPAAVVESFTRAIQPLVLNRCATAGCHVGPKSPEPRFLHRNSRGHIDRQVTLANLQTVSHLTGNPRGFDRLVQEWLTGHPRPADAAPLDQASANAVRNWLTSKRAIESQPGIAAQPRPNRFQAMLEAAANPVPLWPPPQEPRGILLPDDRTTEADESGAD